MRSTGIFAAGVVLGVLVGLPIGLRMADDSTSESALEAPPTAAEVSAEPHGVNVPAVARASRTASAPGVPGAADSSAEIAALIQENGQLEAQLAESQRQLAEALEDQPGAEPIPRPDNLEARFTEQSLLRSVTEGLKEAGFENAEVTSIDCTEHPCIVYGEGMGNKGDLPRLQKTAALSAYKGDAKRTYGAAFRAADGGLNRQYFGFAAFPRVKGAAEKKAIEERLEFRFGEMQKTFAK